MLKIGLQDVTGLYVGETKIEKAYLGGDLVFSAAKKPSRLPEGYTELEYISTTGKQTILTSIFPTADTEIEADISVDYSDDASVLRLLSSSIYTGKEYYLFIFNFTKSTTMYGNANMGKNNGTGIKISDISTYKKLHITYSTKEKFASIDEKSIQFSSNEVYSKQPAFRLFGASFSASSGTVGNAFYGKIYNFVLKQGGAEKLNLVPCKNADGITGFYNLVDGSFIGSQGAVPFVAGPVV